MCASCAFKQFLLTLKNISVIICLPQGLENEAFSICCVLVSCIGTVSSGFLGKMQYVRDTLTNNSYFSLGILSNEFK